MNLLKPISIAAAVCVLSMPFSVFATATTLNNAVVAPGTKLVAGDTTQNEFFILDGQPQSIKPIYHQHRLDKALDLAFNQATLHSSQAKSQKILANHRPHYLHQSLPHSANASHTLHSTHSLAKNTLHNTHSKYHLTA